MYLLIIENRAMAQRFIKNVEPSGMKFSTILCVKDFGEKVIEQFDFVYNNHTIITYADVGQNVIDHIMFKVE
jgi:hypothetical protein